MQGKKISIIIPVYNVVDYIEECLDSVINQTYCNLQIIIVDDGSTDGSTDICRRYAERDDRIKLIVQSNKGVAAARKVAVQEATGKCLGFVDADDYIELNYYERLLDAMNDCDIVTSGWLKGCNDEGKYYDRMPEGIYNTKEEMEFLHKNMICYKGGREKGISSFMVVKLYKTDMAKEVFTDIDEDVFLGEDGDFLYRYLLRCRSVNVTRICGYYYRERENSAMHLGNPAYLLNVHKLYNSLREEFERHALKENLLIQLQMWMTRMILWAPGRMGFSECAKNIKYVFPYMNELKGKKIILYGAGAVGKDYFSLIRDKQECDIVLWIDKAWKRCKDNGFNVHPITDVCQKDYDYVVIALKEEAVADMVKRDLESMGVTTKKILWGEPLNILIHRNILA